MTSRDGVLRDRYLRCLIWLSEVDPKIITGWLDDRFPGLKDESFPFLPFDFNNFLHNFVYPAFIERFMPWLMPHWPLVRCCSSIRNAYEFPKTGTALIMFWRSDVGGVINGIPTHLGTIVLRDERVYDPDADRLFTVAEYIETWEKAQALTQAEMRIVYVAEKPLIQ